MRKSNRPLRDSFENILIAIFLALLVRTYLVTGYKVPTSSMAPTLLPGDFIFAFKPPAGFKIPLTSTKIAVQVPERGDLMVFTFPDQPRTNYVKRVVGLPGDKVQMFEGRLSINDVPLEYRRLNDPVYEQYDVWEEKDGERRREILRMRDRKGKDFGPLTVPPGEVFVLGDHRDTSDDSRYWGTVPLNRLEGRVVLIWLSLDWERRWAEDRFPHLRTERLFKPLR